MARTCWERSRGTFTEVQEAMEGRHGLSNRLCVSHLQGVYDCLIDFGELG